MKSEQDNSNTRLITYQQELERVKNLEPKDYASFLNSLSGKAVVAIKGFVFRPRLTRAFGDWIMIPPKIPNGDSYELLDGERIDTNDQWPYIKGQISFILGWSQEKDGKVITCAGQNVEDGQPRIMFPKELERFDILEVLNYDVFEKEEIEHDLKLLNRNSQKA